MKSLGVSILVTVVLLGIVGLGGYAMLPRFMDQTLTPTVRQVDELKKGLADVKAFVDEERASRAAAVLPRDADISGVIDQINRLTARVTSVETGVSALGDRLTAAEGEFKSTLDTTASSFLAEISAVREEISASAAGAREAREARLKEIVGKIEVLDAYFLLENARTHLLKAKSDLLAQNLGNARDEIRKAVALFSELSSSAVGQRTGIRSLGERLGQLEDNIREDPETGVTRIDLLWNDLGRALRPTQQEAEGPETKQPETVQPPPKITGKSGGTKPS